MKAAFAPGPIRLSIQLGLDGDVKPSVAREWSRIKPKTE
jgi:hypothetical protein